MRIVLTLFILLAVACKCPKKAVAQTNVQMQDSNGLTQIMEDSYGGTEEESLQVIRSGAELQKFFSRVNRTRKPGLPIPDVDFERYQLLVFSAGRLQGTPSPELEIRESRKEQIMLGFKEATGKSDSNSSTAVTTPFVLYTMPHSEKKVVLLNK